MEENVSTKILNDDKATSARKVVIETPAVQTPTGNPNSDLKIHIGDLKDGEFASKGEEDSYGEFNMEAAMSSDVIRAGGFGARDDISSCFPVASDSTDFESSLLDARGYEEPQKKIDRPGLGYTK